jgi:PilZ domain-containing protein
MTLPYAALDLTSLPAWVAPAIGVASAGLAFACGFAVLGRRRRLTAAPADPAAPAQPATPADPFVEGSGSERRAAHRRQGSQVQALVAEGDDTAHAVPCWVVDRSVGGLGLRMDTPVTTGAVLRVRPRDATPIIPWTEVEVKSCRQHGDSWEVGCRFVRTPPWSVLLLFG